MVSIADLARAIIRYLCPNNLAVAVKQFRCLFNTICPN